MKTELFSRLSRILPPPAILGSNTSSISLTRLAAAAAKAGKGMDGGNDLASRVVGSAASTGWSDKGLELTLPESTSLIPSLRCEQPR